MNSRHRKSSSLTASKQSEFRNLQSEINRKPLKVAVLGAGNMGICLTQAFRRIPSVTMKYVYSRTLSRAQNLAQRVNAEPLDQMGKIFDDPEVAGVIICLPTHTRMEILRSAVKAEKHIFCEKPLALNRAMADDIARLFKEYPRTVMIGQVLRFFWEYSRLRQVIQSGSIGQIGTVRLSRCVGYPGSDSWFADPEKSGGVILDLLIHDIDFLRWTFGEIKQVYARALTYTQVGRLDYALLNIQMRSGVLAHLEGSWAHPVGSFHQTVEICGSRGMLSYDNLASKSLKWVCTAPSEREMGSRISLPETDASNDPYFAEVSHFVDCIHGHRTPEVTCDEALKSCDVAFAALESARQGVPIEFDNLL